ncbi:MAG: Smr/MutS family protein [Myxococcota bacterium]|nr:Smr/MutS family protein [Myxococcota bacterium]
MSGKDRDPPSDEFASALGGVNPISDRSKRVHNPSRPAGGPPAESHPDPFVHPDPAEPRFAHRQLAKQATVARLRSGSLEPQRRIDLHQMRAEPARQAVAQAIEATARAGSSVLLVVHGRGRHHGGVSVLREELPGWLEAIDRVVAYAPAPGRDRGTGATLVLIRSS